MVTAIIWDASAVLTLIEKMRAHQGDSTGVEGKRGAGGAPDLVATLCAFGNMSDDGTIIVGVDERNEFAVTWVTDPARVERRSLHKPVRRRSRRLPRTSRP